MTAFSANLGFLWADRPLPDAIRAAKAAGFAAVECHWPYETPAAAVKAALAETGLPMLGLNTRRGDIVAGEFGLAAVPGREDAAIAAIDEALAYAAAVGCQATHVMAGRATGDQARRVFIANLKTAAARARECGVTVLIEPLNRHDAPGYFLRRTDQARDIIETVGADNLKLMFDCYHVAREEGDITTRLRDLAPIIGHIQFAAVPDRGPPDHGELDYAHVFAVIADIADELGRQTPLGAEYKPAGETEASLGWMRRYE